MRIIHFTLGRVDPDSINGINRVVEGLARTMNHNKIAEVQVITLRKNLESKKREFINRDGFDVCACNCISDVLKLFSEIKEYVDLVHLHNAWSIQNVRVGAWLEKHKIPYLLTPHAAFLPDRMTRKTWRKIFFHRILQKRLLDKSAGVIAVSRDEITSISQFTSNQNIEFVPNGSKEINWQKYCKRQRNPEIVTVGYIGRIGREKNIKSLIKAVHLLPVEIQARLRLQIFGELNTDYAKKCQHLALSLNVSKTVEFFGKVSATDKWEVLGTLDAYIQPSLSEAASIAVLEAISMALPIIATRTSGISYWHGYPFVKMVEPVLDELKRGLEELILDRENLLDRGLEAREFYEQNFTWDKVAKRHYEFYQSCIINN